MSTATQISERPILFSEEMVRAILAERKTQTRRIVNPQPHFSEGHKCWMQSCGRAKHMNLRKEETIDPKTGKILHTREYQLPFNEWMMERCPFEVGMTLWVRENFSVRGLMHGATIADVSKYAKRETCIAYAADGKEGKQAWKWRPSIHLPRWACRLELEVTGVRVECLQDITEADAEAEGCRACGSEQSSSFTAAADQFKSLWDSINGKTFPWASNPWVWAVSFRVVKGGGK